MLLLEAAAVIVIFEVIVAGIGRGFGCTAGDVPSRVNFGCCFGNTSRV
jgi:hypothetical protein